MNARVVVVALALSSACSDPPPPQQPWSGPLLASNRATHVAVDRWSWCRSGSGVEIRGVARNTSGARLHASATMFFAVLVEIRGSESVVVASHEVMPSFGLDAGEHTPFRSWFDGRPTSDRLELFVFDMPKAPDDD